MLPHPTCFFCSLYPQGAGLSCCPPGRNSSVGAVDRRGRATSLGGRSRGVVPGTGVAPAPASRGPGVKTASWLSQCFPACSMREACARQYLRPQPHPCPPSAPHRGHPSSNRSAHGPDARADRYWQGGAPLRPSTCVPSGRRPLCWASPRASTNPGRGSAPSGLSPPPGPPLTTLRLSETRGKLRLSFVALGSAGCLPHHLSQPCSHEGWGRADRPQLGSQGLLWAPRHPPPLTPGVHRPSFPQVRRVCRGGQGPS